MAGSLEGFLVVLMNSLVWMGLLGPAHGEQEQSCSRYPLPCPDAFSPSSSLTSAWMPRCATWLVPWDKAGTDSQNRGLFETFLFRLLHFFPPSRNVWFRQKIYPPHPVHF